MKKLTQAEYIEDLKAGSHFIAALHFNNITHDETLDKLTELFKLPYQELKEHTCYKYTKVTKRSKDIVMLREDNTNSYRDFHGLNSYYTHKQILIHVNKQFNGSNHSHPDESVTTIFINL